MCLAIPARVTALLEGGRAKVELGGVQKDISVALVDDVKVGDYVVVHVGYALGRMDAADAENTLKLFREMGDGAAPGAMP